MIVTERSGDLLCLTYTGYVTDADLDAHRAALDPPPAAVVHDESHADHPDGAPQAWIRSYRATEGLQALAWVTTPDELEYLKRLSVGLQRVLGFPVDAFASQEEAKAWASGLTDPGGEVAVR